MECQTIFSKRGNNWGTLTVPLKLLQGSWLPSVPRKSLYFRPWLHSYVWSAAGLQEVLKVCQNNSLRKCIRPLSGECSPGTR